ncbi:PRD domain-containing protein [Companilactobacillus zhachilii]|uniref:PRD domain-containing protein n=1 Tax=Companilactobacillus zhachilii TaxID=2304606 RepID=A0A386PW48_9LACO|nr:BglG family transcription antiterminator [Companilactobacillus zhachilii]AYE39195.1 PRD domain-containing protein [Companilactobacillus zhachilii]
MLVDNNLLNYHLVQFIKNRKSVHYGDIENHFDISRKTILKHLDEIEILAKECDVDLVRKPNVGIYFQGNVDDLLTQLNQQQRKGLIPENKQERVRYITTRLLMSNNPFTIQSMAEELFVSRTTLESDIKNVRKYLEEQNIKIYSNQQGIYLKVDESSRRKNISKLLQDFWNQTTYVEKRGEKLSRHIQLNGDFYQLFNYQDITQVIKCVNEFEDASKLILTDYEYESLIIHLTIALQRIRNNKFLNNNQESNAALEKNTILLINKIEKTFQINIPVLEKQYLNIHVLAIEGKEIGEQGFNDDFENFLKEHLTKSLSYDKELISGLILHLRPALSRSNYGLGIRNPYTKQIKKVYPEAFEQAMQLCLAIRDKYSIELNEDETAYVALHIQSFIERRSAKGQIQAVIVCSTGLGTSRFLEQQLKTKVTHHIEVISVMSVSEFLKSNINVDIIISTIPIKNTSIPVILVSPFLTNQDIETLDLNISVIEKKKIQSRDFLDLIDTNLISFVETKCTRKGALKIITDRLKDEKYASAGVLKSAEKRESISTTSFGSIATPHCDPRYVLTPNISILIALMELNGERKKLK